MLGDTGTPSSDENSCRIDGGLKCCGHPIGASGSRMAYEVCSRLLGRAGDQGLAAISILGLH